MMLGTRLGLGKLLFPAPRRIVKLAQRKTAADMTTGSICR